MADGGYQRTCTRCQRTWLVPTDIAEERPNLKAAASQYLSMIGGKYADQVALRTHYQQLAAAAKCPQCGATPSAVPPSAPQGSPAPDVQTLIYVLNQKLISLTGDLWIEDGQGNHAFEVDGTLLSLRGTHVLKDLGGQALYEISKPLAPHLHKTIEIKKDGHVSATVQEAIFHLGGDKFKITLAGGQELTVHGDWMNREFQVKDQAGGIVIDASRAWFSIHDAYGIQIAPGFEVPLGLAIVVALERVEVQEQGDQSPIQNLLGGIGLF